MAFCPRCNVRLQEEIYEGFEALFCSTCWGHWMTREVFTGVLRHEGYTFDDEEKKSVMAHLAAKSKPDISSDGILNCPVCDSIMEKKEFSDACPVLLDLCHQHGVWLDAAEVKQVQVYFDSLE